MSISEEELQRIEQDCLPVFGLGPRIQIKKLIAEVRAQAARIVELEAERDALTAKAAHLYKLSELPCVSLGIVCEDRDRLKHSDRELRKCIAELEAERDALRIDSDRMRDQMSCDLERLDGENAAMRRLCSVQLKENAALRKTLEEAQAALGNIAYEVDAEERQPAAHIAFMAISPILRIPEAAATVHGAPKP